MRKYSFTLFLVFVFVFCGYDLYFWILFQFSCLILYFFGCVPCWGCLCPFGDLCFCFLVIVKILELKRPSSRESPDFSGIPENYSREKRLYILLILEILGNSQEQEYF